MNLSWGTIKLHILKGGWRKRLAFLVARGEWGILGAVSHSYFKVKHHSVALGGIIQLLWQGYASRWGWTNRHSGTPLLFITSRNKIIREEEQFTYFPTLIILQPSNETLCKDFNSLLFVLDSHTSMRKFKKLVYLLHLIFSERALCWFDHNGFEKILGLNTST